MQFWSEWSPEPGNDWSKTAADSNDYFAIYHSMSENWNAPFVQEVNIDKVKGYKIFYYCKFPVSAAGNKIKTR